MPKCAIIINVDASQSMACFAVLLWMYREIGNSIMFYVHIVYSLDKPEGQSCQ